MRHKRLALLSGLLLVAVLLHPPALAAEPGEREPGDQQVELTLQEVVDMALQHDLGLVRADVSLRLAREQEDAAREGYQQAEYQLPRVDGYILYLPGNELTSRVEQAYYGYLGAQAKTEMAEKQLQVAADRVVKDAYQKYLDVLAAQEALEAAASNAAAAEAKLKAAQAKFQGGMISRLELQRARQDWSTAQASLASADITLEEAYRALNNLIGLPETARPVLAEEVALHPVDPIADIAAYTSGVLARDPVLWINQRQVDLQETLSRQYGSDDEVAELTVRDAELARDEYRQGMEEAIPVIYEGILQAEEEYEALQQALATAQESLRVAELSYEVGLVTMADVLAAETGVAQLEAQLLRLAVQHELAKLTLEKPWVQAAAAPGGAGG